MGVPLILCDLDRAELAFAAHCALVKAETENPALANNPFWTMLRHDTWEAFVTAYEKVS